MPDSIAFAAAVAGFGLIIVVGARLGAGSPLSLAGLVAAQGRNDWPRGVQETDVPRFAIAHADALRRDAGAPEGNAGFPEIVEVYEGPLGRGGP